MLVLLHAFFISLALAQGAPVVHWVDESKESVVVRGEVETDLVETCVNSGLRVEYRFLLRLCRHHSNWFDSCESVQKQLHHVAYDPVTRSFQLSTDRLRDDQPQTRLTFEKLSSALTALVRIPDLPLLFLSGNFPAGSDANAEQKERFLRNHYIDVRTIATCQGEYSETLTQVSYLLTLGLVDLGGKDSGWEDVPLSSLE
ncbi:MAG: DUF4390 domain-containing protein [Bdellovibrionales bacterium]|nr:DUF4390 domain-containing protein [Bdellovibrionales bacterium]